MLNSLEPSESFEDYRYSQSVAVVVRWLVLGTWLVLLNYRDELAGGSLVTLNLLAIPLLATNAYVTWRIKARRPITARYVYTLSLLDVTLLTAGLATTTGFGNPFFVYYYPVLIGFSVVFHRRRITFGLATLAIGGYVLVSLTTEPGVDFDMNEERILVFTGELNWDITLTSNFNEYATVEAGEDNIVTDSLTTLTLQVEDSFSARFAFEVVNNSKVPEGVEHIDTIISVTLVYTF